MSRLRHTGSHCWIVMLALGIASVLSAQTLAPPRVATGSGAGGSAPGSRTIAFDVDEGTWLNLDVSPDGRTIVFDLLGDLYTVPIAGGSATALTTGRPWDRQAAFSPDGHLIAFISDRDGIENVWVVNRDGTGARQITRSETLRMGSPAWMPDGRHIVARKFRMAMSEMWSYPVDPSARDTAVLITSSREYPDVAGPVASSDGRFLYFASGAASPMDLDPYNLFRLNLRDHTSRKLTQGGERGARPALSPDGRSLAYVKLARNVASLRVRDLETGRERLLVRELAPRSSDQTPYEDVFPHFAFLPDGRSLLVTNGGKIHRIDVTTGHDAIIPFRVHVAREVDEPVSPLSRVPDDSIRVRALTWHTLSPDGKHLAFSAIGRLWIGQLNGDGKPVVPHRLTQAAEREYAPAFSPDGRWIAYTTWTDSGGGHVRLVSPDGRERKQLTSVAGHYLNPTWSPDGGRVVFLRGSGIEFRTGVSGDDQYDVMWVGRDGGPTKLITTRTTVGAIALRHHPVVSVSGDGARLFYVERTGAGAHASADGQIGTLTSVTLDGSDRREHFRVMAADEIIPSPDGRRAALSALGGVWLVDMPAHATDTIRLDPSAAGVKHLTRQGGTFVRWVDSATVGWGLAAHYYRYRVGDTQPQEAATVALSAPVRRPKGTMALTNARIITMKGDAVIERGTIVVRDNRLIAVGASNDVQVPSGATTLDVAGKTIMPGLIDVHDHIGHDGDDLIMQNVWGYLANLAYGVTTAYDPSHADVTVFPQAEMVAAGESMGPRTYSSGEVMFGGFDWWPPFVNIRSLDDARGVVNARVAYGALELKEYFQPRRDQRAWLAQAAREAGVRITAEGGWYFTKTLAEIVDGYTAWEHALSVAPVYRDVREFIARSGVYYTPTLVTDYPYPATDDWFRRGNYYNDPKAKRFIPDGARERLSYWTVTAEDTLASMATSKAAADIAHAGGLLAVGGHGNMQGLSTQWELWALAMGGLTPMEAIRAGTLRGAQKIGLDQDLGSVEVGKIADLLVLDGNPLTDVRQTAHIAYVVANGFVYEGQTLNEVWPTKRALPKLPWW